MSRTDDFGLGSQVTMTSEFIKKFKVHYRKGKNHKILCEDSVLSLSLPLRDRKREREFNSIYF